MINYKNDLINNKKLIDYINSIKFTEFNIKINNLNNYINILKRDDKIWSIIKNENNKMYRCNCVYIENGEMFNLDITIDFIRIYHNNKIFINKIKKHLINLNKKSDQK